MRRLNPLGLMVLSAAAMSLANINRRSVFDPPPPPKVDSKERLSKAEKKRARKNAQRAKLAKKL